MWDILISKVFHDLILIEAANSFLARGLYLAYTCSAFTLVPQRSWSGG